MTASSYSTSSASRAWAEGSSLVRSCSASRSSRAAIRQTLARGRSGSSTGRLQTGSPSTYSRPSAARSHSARSGRKGLQYANWDTAERKLRSVVERNAIAVHELYFDLHRMYRLMGDRDLARL